MTNREAFHQIFDIYSTELWAMKEEELLEWQLREFKSPKFVTDEMKREYLTEFCQNQDVCLACPLFIDKFNCGREAYFDNKTAMPPEMIEAAYMLAKYNIEI